MKAFGIVSEYNPFHNGHKYHIQAARESFGADSIVCIMSGSFVQRGEPAIIDKWSRAKMAVLSGADLVIELPFVYACQPAEIFAFGAVNTLNNLGILEGICFGSELGDVTVLQTLASLLITEPEPFSKLIKQYLKDGNTYPRAVSLALKDYCQVNAFELAEAAWENPNNILGIEYIKSILQLNSPLKPYTVKRIANHYNDLEITQPIASATAVRQELKNTGISEKLQMSMPQSALQILETEIAAGKGPIYLESLSDILLYRLRMMTAEQIQSYMSISEGLEHRIKKVADKATSFQELIAGIKTKRYTQAFLQRLLCNILVDLDWETAKLFKQVGTPSYFRVLAFNDKGKYLIKKITEGSAFPIINKVAAFQTDHVRINQMFDYDLRASDIINLARPNRSFKKAGEDFLISPAYL